MRFVAAKEAVGGQYLLIGTDGFGNQNTFCFIIEEEGHTVIGIQADDILQLPESPSFGGGQAQLFVLLRFKGFHQAGKAVVPIGIAIAEFFDGLDQIFRVDGLEQVVDGVAAESFGGVVVVTGSKDDAELAKDIAMHIAAVNPDFVKESDVPAEVVAKEKEILMAQVEESGKPAEIVEKMIGGRLRKFLAGITLYGQAFVKDPEVTVEKLLKSSGANVLSFTRMEVGEGIEKKEDNFAEEVMAQARGE